jgi:hypothetical protein
MVNAYVLIQTEVGKAAGSAAQAIRAINGVEWADDLAGPYDVIARVHAPGLNELGRLVVARIQVVAGVTRTLTCMVIRRKPPSGNALPRLGLNHFTVPTTIVALPALGGLASSRAVPGCAGSCRLIMPHGIAWNRSCCCSPWRSSTW